MSMEGYELQRMGQHGVVTVPAEVDVTNIGEVRQALLSAASQDVPVLIIDMSGTTFCDSAGVQVIIDTYNRVTAARIRLRLVATAVMRVLTLTGVDQLMPIYPTLEAALAGAPRG
jgi:anti-anti-sigma factor